jgi:uncharacterized membrane protein
VRVLVAVVGLGYPLLVYAGLVFFEPRVLVAGAGLLLLARAASSWRTWKRRDILRVTAPVALVAIVLVVAAIFNDGRAFLFVPALVNAALLIGFGRTLVRGPSMIETYARLRHPEMPSSRAPYLRAVTGMWCVFFAVNLAISVFLAVYGTLEAWTVYNGVVAYVLIGSLLAAERVYRYWRFRGYHGDLLDPFFRRVFPPPAAGGRR